MTRNTLLKAMIHTPASLVRLEAVSFGRRWRAIKVPGSNVYACFTLPLYIDALSTGAPGTHLNLGVVAEVHLIDERDGELPVELAKTLTSELWLPPSRVLQWARRPTMTLADVLSAFNDLRAVIRSERDVILFFIILDKALRQRGFRPKDYEMFMSPGAYRRGVAVGVPVNYECRLHSPDVVVTFEHRFERESGTIFFVWPVEAKLLIDRRSSYTLRVSIKGELARSLGEQEDKFEKTVRGIAEARGLEADFEFMYGHLNASEHVTDIDIYAKSRSTPRPFIPSPAVATELASFIPGVCDVVESVLGVVERG